ncbi:hypothetical protein DFJ73DRAFT_343435 [Zopfochytrium polystomum]|nr:hypothetical protein DFJ73DRAFT_132871 [Zopfochytrium polystomum]KAI9353076.1 hypothetical protein DFJ73DRAFT_343435 [Zopfochytrium polystomum]
MTALLAGGEEATKLAVALAQFTHKRPHVVDNAFVHVPYVKPTNFERRSRDSLVKDLRTRTQEVKTLKNEVRKWTSKCEKWHLKEPSVQKLLDLYGSEVLPKIRAQKAQDLALLAVKAISSGYLDMNRLQYHFVCSQMKMYTLKNLCGQASAKLFSEVIWSKFIYLHSSSCESRKSIDAL